MLSCIPRSDPGALTCHTHTSARLTRSKSHPLPYGPVARMLLAWVHSEASRTRDCFLYFGASFRWFVAALDIDPVMLYDQMQRLFGCTLECTHGTSRMAPWFIFLWPGGLAASRFPDPDSLVRLGDALWADIRSHRIELTLEPLRALAHTPLGLDLYLWELHRYAQRAEPRALSALRVYHELAEHTSARPTDAEASAFLCEASAALEGAGNLAGLLSHPVAEVPGSGRGMGLIPHA